MVQIIERELSCHLYTPNERDYRGVGRDDAGVGEAPAGVRQLALGSAPQWLASDGGKH